MVAALALVNPGHESRHNTLLQCVFRLAALARLSAPAFLFRPFPQPLYATHVSMHCASSPTRGCLGGCSHASGVRNVPPIGRIPLNLTDKSKMNFPQCASYENGSRVSRDRGLTLTHSTRGGANPERAVPWADSVANSATPNSTTSPWGAAARMHDRFLRRSCEIGVRVDAAWKIFIGRRGARAFLSRCALEV